MDKTTFGNTPASHVLVHLLNELNNKHITSKVMTFYKSYMHELNMIQLILPMDQQVYAKLLYLLTEKRYATIESSSLPKKIKDFLKNTISAHFKETLKSL